jgi:hypothetical protein
MESAASSLRAYFGRDGPAAPVLVAAAPGVWSARVDRMLARRAGWRARTLAPDPATFVGSLDRRRRSRLRCVVGPAALGVAAHLPESRACAVVRHPTDLVASRYYAAKEDREQPRPSDEELLDVLATMPLDRVYERFAAAAPPSGPVHRRWSAYCNPQARMLLGGAALPFTAGPPADADAWRERLWAVVDGLDTVARPDTLERIVGAKVATKHDTVGTGAAQLLPAARAAVRAYNWLDLELYARAGPQTRKGVPRDEIPRRPVAIGGRRVELLFDTDDRHELPPVGVFQHIPKTGGSSLKRMLREALPDARCEQLWTPGRPGPASTVAEWYRDLVAGLGPTGLATLRFCSSHTANFVLSQLDGDAVAFCIVRDAVDRTVSHYAFDNPSVEDVPRALADVYATWAGASPSDSRGAFKQRLYFNYQARVLLAPELDVNELPYTAGPPPDAERWREALFATAERYLVGTTERFDAAARRFAATTGLVLAGDVHEKVNAHRPRLADLDRGLIDEIRAYNWLDTELHAAFAAA